MCNHKFSQREETPVLKKINNGIVNTISNIKNLRHCEYVVESLLRGNKR